jgi:hypothetical protein
MVTALKGINPTIVKLNGKLAGITHFVICSGESTRHLQTIADSLVRSVGCPCLSLLPSPQWSQVRDRKLVKAPSYKFGAEGTPASRMSPPSLCVTLLIFSSLPLSWLRLDGDRHVECCCPSHDAQSVFPSLSLSLSLSLTSPLLRHAEEIQFGSTLDSPLATLCGLSRGIQRQESTGEISRLFG